MEDFLVDFEGFFIMDCKMGSRIYLEEELVKVWECFCFWKDMYEKMVVVDFGVFIFEEYV